MSLHELVCFSWNCILSFRMCAMKRARACVCVFVETILKLWFCYLMQCREIHSLWYCIVWCQIPKIGGTAVRWIYCNVIFVSLFSHSLVRLQILLPFWFLYCAFFSIFFSLSFYSLHLYARCFIWHYLYSWMWNDCVSLSRMSILKRPTRSCDNK